MRSPSKKETFLVFVFGLLLAAIWTWPLVPSLGTSLPYDGRFVEPGASDMHIWVWDFWWVGEAVAGRGDFFHSDQIYLPYGQSLALHTHVFLWGFLTLPLQWIGGPVFAVGCALLLLFAGAFAATWVLLRTLGIGRLGSGFGAFAWAFSPYFVQKSLEHMDFGATPLPPLFLLFLLKWLHSDKHSGLKPAIGAGAVFGLTLLSSPLGALATLLLGLLVVAFLPPLPRLGQRRGERSRLFQAPTLMVSIFVATAVGWPWIVELVNELTSIAEFGLLYPEFEGAIQRETTAYAQLTDFIRLPGLHPLVLALTEPGNLPGVSPNAPAGWNELSGLRISFTLLPLGFFALVGRRHLLPWALLAASLFLFTWDPGLGDGGGVLSGLMRAIPGLETLRVPARFFPFFLLPCVVLAAIGFDRLLGYSKGLAGFAFLFLGAEYIVSSTPLMDLTPPPAVAALGKEVGSAGVLTLPVRFGASEAMTWQAHHGQAAAFSYVARPNPKTLFLWGELTPDLRALALPKFQARGKLQLPDSAALEMDLLHAGIGNVLVSAEELSSTPVVLSEVEDLLDSLPGWERRDVPGTVLWWSRIQ